MDPASELTSMVSSPHTLLRRLWISIGLEPLVVRNAVTTTDRTTLCIVRTPTTSAILHCCCVSRTWLTGVLMIVVELDSVAIRWVKQETLPGATFNWGAGGGITFIPTFVYQSPIERHLHFEPV
jgi:hypothetical protein